MLKDQPEHPPEVLARVTRVEPGAVSDSGRQALRGWRDPMGRLLRSHPTAIGPDRPSRRRSRPHRIGEDRGR